MSIKSSTAIVDPTSSISSMNAEQLISILKESETGKKLYENAEQQVKACGLKLEVIIVPIEEITKRMGYPFDACFSSRSGIIRIAKGHNEKHMLKNLAFELLNASSTSRLKEIDEDVVIGKISSSKSYAIKKLEIERENMILSQSALEEIRKNEIWKQLKGDDLKPSILGKDINEACRIFHIHVSTYKQQFEEIRARAIEKQLKDFKRIAPASIATTSIKSDCVEVQTKRATPMAKLIKKEDGPSSTSEAMITWAMTSDRSKPIYDKAIQAMKKGGYDGIIIRFVPQERLLTSSFFNPIEGQILIDETLSSKEMQEALMFELENASCVNDMVEALASSDYPKKIEEIENESRKRVGMKVTTTQLAQRRKINTQLYKS